MRQRLTPTRFLSVPFPGTPGEGRVGVFQRHLLETKNAHGACTMGFFDSGLQAVQTHGASTVGVPAPARYAHQNLRAMTLVHRQSDWRCCTVVACILAVLFVLTTGVSAATNPATIARDAGIDQRLGEQIPADLPFVDETGQPVTLARYFGGEGAKPTLLVLAYFTCPDLCPITLSHLTQGLNGVALRAGRDFRLVVVSFDPQDTPAVAASRQAQYVRAYKGGGGAGWHFLTGSQASIDRLKQAVGFRCTFEGGNNRFAHAAGVMAVTPGGRLSHYFYGTDYSPADLEAGLKDAMTGHATAVEQPDQQYCFAYDPRSGRYGRIITRTLQATGALWVLALAGYIGLKLAHDLRGGAPRRPQ